MYVGISIVNCVDQNHTRLRVQLFFVTADLLKLFEDSASKFERYKERVNKLL